MQDEIADNPGSPQAPAAVSQELPASADAPSVTMRQGVTGVLTYCRQLTSAIHDHDFEAVMVIAAKAVNLWFSARRACRRLLAESERPTPLAYVAIEAIDDTYRRLVELFRNATEQIQVPRMRQVLANLRAEMSVARADPLLGPEPGATAPSRPKGNL